MLTRYCIRLLLHATADLESMADWQTLELTWSHYGTADLYVMYWEDASQLKLTSCVGC